MQAALTLHTCRMALAERPALQAQAPPLARVRSSFCCKCPKLEGPRAAAAGYVSERQAPREMPRRKVTPGLRRGLPRERSQGPGWNPCPPPIVTRSAEHCPKPGGRGLPHPAPRSTSPRARGGGLLLPEPPPASSPPSPPSARSRPFSFCTTPSPHPMEAFWGQTGISIPRLSATNYGPRREVAEMREWSLK